MSEHLRIGDSERDRAADDLADHYARGRLGTAEHAERLDAIWTARTRADLAAIFEDLPPSAPPERGPTRGRLDNLADRSWRPIPFLPFAALFVVLTVLTGLPFWILIFVMAWVLIRLRIRARASARHDRHLRRAGTLSRCTWQAPRHPH